MIPDVDIWRAALLMTKRYDADAMLEAAARADQLLEDGDPAGAAIWYRILDAVEGGEGALTPLTDTSPAARTLP